MKEMRFNSFKFKNDILIGMTIKVLIDLIIIIITLKAFSLIEWSWFKTIFVPFAALISFLVIGFAMHLEEVGESMVFDFKDGKLKSFNEWVKDNNIPENEAEDLRNKFQKGEQFFFKKSDLEQNEEEQQEEEDGEE